MPSRSAQMESWSTAAARKVSLAQSMTFLPSVVRKRASLAMEVVLPTPLTPQTRMTVGGTGAQRTSLPFSVSLRFRSFLRKSSTLSVVSISRFL